MLSNKPKDTQRISHHTQCVWLQRHYTAPKVTEQGEQVKLPLPRDMSDQRYWGLGVWHPKPPPIPRIQIFSTSLMSFWNLLNTNVQNRVVCKHIRFKLRSSVLTCFCHNLEEYFLPFHRILYISSFD